jgi:hypothetical protein
VRRRVGPATLIDVYLPDQILPRTFDVERVGDGARVLKACEKLPFGREGGTGRELAGLLHQVVCGTQRGVDPDWDIHTVRIRRAVATVRARKRGERRRSTVTFRLLPGVTLATRT